MLEDLKYSYPEELVATRPHEPCRVLFMDEKKNEPQEISLNEVAAVFKRGDVLVINSSGVKACRIFYGDLEILFLKEVKENYWEVLFKSSKYSVGETLHLPGEVQARFVERGRPQLLQVNKRLTSSYFAEFGSFALPPYIQKLRDNRKPMKEDKTWYQTDWNKDQKSLAAPTASLHFKKQDLTKLKERGVVVAEVSLYVGLGTFLPLEKKNIDEGKLHRENFYVSKETQNILKTAKENKKRIWALGTTALRAVESFENFEKETELFIKPGYEFRWVEGLLTNFHQPGSSLLALVMAFYGIQETKKAYEFAIENKFRLFSYGDLSIWIK